jgi:hypothetical protein
VRTLTKTRKAYYALIPLGLALVLLLLCYETVLTEAGRFLTPEGRGEGGVSYRNEDWWRNDEGVNAFASELTKFVYYVLRGYIPVKSIVTT